VIITGSMAPVINIGDVVIIKEVPGEQVQVGDIILFPLGEMQVVHRVIKVKQTDGRKVFVTKGDANYSPDAGVVLPGNVLGKVILVIPKAGLPTLLLRGGL